MCAASCGPGKRSKKNSAGISNLDWILPARVTKYAVDIIKRYVGKKFFLEVAVRCEMNSRDGITTYSPRQCCGILLLEVGIDLNAQLPSGYPDP
jgi:hypothetical protein